MKKVLPCVLALGTVVSSACLSPLFPGIPSTTATVTVVDEDGDPVAGIKVTFNDWTSTGGQFMVSGTTDGEGRVLFAFAEPGERTCRIQLPAGFSPGPGGVSQVVAIESRKSLSVRFTVVRPAG
jgi:hypothetical protein